MFFCSFGLKVLCSYWKLKTINLDENICSSQGILQLLWLIFLLAAYQRTFSKRPNFKGWVAFMTNSCNRHRGFEKHSTTRWLTLLGWLLWTCVLKYVWPWFHQFDDRPPLPQGPTVWPAVRFVQEGPLLFSHQSAVDFMTLASCWKPPSNLAFPGLITDASSHQTCFPFPAQPGLLFPHIFNIH